MQQGLCNGTVSVCLSCLLTTAAACGGFAAECPMLAILIDCCKAYLLLGPSSNGAAAAWQKVKGKGNPCSITERRVPELISVLGSQPAVDVSHKPGGRLQLPQQPLRGQLSILLLGE